MAGAAPFVPLVTTVLGSVFGGKEDKAPALPPPPAPVEAPPPTVSSAPEAKAEAPVADTEAARLRAAKRRKEASSRKLFSLNSSDETTSLSKSILGND